MGFRVGLGLFRCSWRQAVALSNSSCKLSRAAALAASSGAATGCCRANASWPSRMIASSSSDAPWTSRTPRHVWHRGGSGLPSALVRRHRFDHAPVAVRARDVRRSADQDYVAFEARDHADGADDAPSSVCMRLLAHEGDDLAAPLLVAVLDLRYTSK